MLFFATQPFQATSRAGNKEKNTRSNTRPGRGVISIITLLPFTPTQIMSSGSYSFQTLTEPPGNWVKLSEHFAGAQSDPHAPLPGALQANGELLLTARRKTLYIQHFLWHKADIRFSFRGPWETICAYSLCWHGTRGQGLHSTAPSTQPITQQKPSAALLVLQLHTVPWYPMAKSDKK